MGLRIISPLLVGVAMIDTAKAKLAMGKGEPKAGRKPRALPVNEAAVWQPISGGWRLLHGGIYESGVSIEWHEFALARAFEWSRSFHPDSLELCLNLSGHGSVRCGDSAGDLGPLTA